MSAHPLVVEIQHLEIRGEAENTLLLRALEHWVFWTAVLSGPIGVVSWMSYFLLIQESILAVSGLLSLMASFFAILIMVATHNHAIPQRFATGPLDISLYRAIRRYNKKVEKYRKEVELMIGLGLPIEELTTTTTRRIEKLAAEKEVLEQTLGFYKSMASVPRVELDGLGLVFSSSDDPKELYDVAEEMAMFLKSSHVLRLELAAANQVLEDELGETPIA